ncbi:MAG: hypothetical protein OEV42_15020 [Deltaproteobacteria bacterium]|nr:hypothetical protein [Deltaproteobacteria bacterium]
MEDLVLFGLEVGLSLAASIFVLIYLGGLLKSILTDLCGTEERADFWLGFSKLIFLFFPLLVVIFSSNHSLASTGITSQMLRSIISKVILGELVTLSIVGFVLWMTISTTPQEKSQESINTAKKEVL